MSYTARKSLNQNRKPTDETEEAGLGLLINLTGKLRMLSHRAVMYASLSSMDDGKRREFATRFTEAVDEFTTIADLLSSGDQSRGITQKLLMGLKKRGAITEESRKALARFATDARQVASYLEKGEAVPLAILEPLSSFVAGELLAKLNEINDKIRETLDTILKSRTSSQKDVRKVIDEAISRIEKISLSVRLIALNASVEAARSGDAGKRFNIIANEIKELSEQATASSQEVREKIASL